MPNETTTTESTTGDAAPLTLDDKLYLVKFKVDEGNPHIKIDEAKCAECKEHFCVRCCPAGCYTVEDGKVKISVDGCMECGTCSIACESNAIEWKYPRGGFGVTFTNG